MISRSQGVSSSCASPIPAVPTSMKATSGRAGPLSRSRRMTSTPKPSSPRRTLPNPATRVRTSTLCRRLGAERQTNVAALHRHREHGQALRSVQTMTTPKVVSAAVPATAKLGSLQAAELQGQRAVTALVRDREKLAIDVGEKNAASVDVDDLHGPRLNVADRTEPAVYRLLRAPQPADLEQRTVRRRRAIADDEFLESEKPRAERFFEIAPRGVDGDPAMPEGVELHVDRTANHFGQLHVDAVVVQVTAHAVQSFFGVETAIHRDQIVGHEKQTDRGVGGEPVHEGFARHALDRADQMGQGGPVDGIDALEQAPDGGADCRVGMRLELRHQALNVLENV